MVGKSWFYAALFICALLVLSSCKPEEGTDPDEAQREALHFTLEPAGGAYFTGYEASPLYSSAAAKPGNGAIHYQWYAASSFDENGNPRNGSFTGISGGSLADPQGGFLPSITPDTSTPGVLYYWVECWNSDAETNGEPDKRVKSAAVMVTVSEERAEPVTAVILVMASPGLTLTSAALTAGEESVSVPRNGGAVTVPAGSESEVWTLTGCEGLAVSPDDGIVSVKAGQTVMIGVGEDGSQPLTTAAISVWTTGRLEGMAYKVSPADGKAYLSSSTGGLDNIPVDSAGGTYQVPPGGTWTLNYIVPLGYKNAGEERTQGYTPHTILGVGQTADIHVPLESLIYPAVLLLSPPEVTYAIGVDEVRPFAINVSVPAGVTRDFEYQWYRNGAAIEGETAETFTPDCTESGLGTNYYYVRVRHVETGGEAFSAGVSVTVTYGIRFFDTTSESGITYNLLASATGGGASRESVVTLPGAAPVSGLWQEAPYDGAPYNGVTGTPITSADTGRPVFKGWTTEPDYYGDYYMPEETFILRGSANLYAVWSAEDEDNCSPDSPFIITPYDQEHGYSSFTVTDSSIIFVPRQEDASQGDA